MTARPSLEKPQNLCELFQDVTDGWNPISLGLGSQLPQSFELWKATLKRHLWEGWGGPPTNSHRWPYGATAKCWSSVQWESWGGIAVLLCHVKHETWNAPLRFKGWKIKIISFTLAWDERKGHWHCDCYANVFLQLGPLDHLRQHLAVGLKPAASSVSRSVNFTAKWSEFVVWWAPWSNSACWGCQKWSLSNPAKLTPKMEVFRLDFHST